METKKPTRGQLEKRIERAVIHIDRTKDTISIFFSDKGLRLTVDDDYAIVETGFHRHIFTSFTSSGISRPWMYIKRFVTIALENEDGIKTENGYSYQKLFNLLHEKEDKTHYNIAQFVDWWLFNIFAPLYEIGESQAETFLVYERFIHNLARQQVILDEKKEDVTNKQFVEKVTQLEKEMSANVAESVVFKKKTDEELMKEEINAIKEQELEETTQAGNEAN